jgi:serine phosphatase RsbU (regulator of sigma subunit)
MLEPTDTLVVYSDDVVEYRNPEGEEFDDALTRHAE